MVRVCIVGAGGIGGWLAGGLLGAAVSEVVVIARGKHGTVLKEKGLNVRLTPGDGSFGRTLEFPAAKFELFASVADALACGSKPVDYAILGVKTWQVREACQEVRPFLAPDGCVITTQNGTEAPQEAREVLGATRVLGGVCQVVSFIAEPGVVQVLEKPTVFKFGEVFGENGTRLRDGRSGRVEALLPSFDASFVTVSIAEDTWKAIWDKAGFLCCVGPVTALTRAPADKLLFYPETRQLLKTAMLEWAACAVAEGHLSPEAIHSEIEGKLSAIERLPPGTTPSTLRDVVMGRPSEIHELTGCIQRAGKRLGVATPTHDFVFAALLPQEARARGEDPYELAGVPGGAPHVRVC